MLHFLPEYRKKNVIVGKRDIKKYAKQEMISKKKRKEGMSIEKVLNLSMVPRPFLKPNWDRGKIFLLSRKHFNLFLTICTIILHRVDVMLW